MIKFGMFLYRLTNRPYKRVIFCCFVCLGTPAIFGIFSMSAISPDLKWKFGAVMLGLALFFALALWPASMYTTKEEQ